MESEPREYRVEEVAALVGCSENNVYKAIRLGLLSARIVLVAGARGEYRITEEHFREWRRKTKRGRPPKGWPGRPGVVSAPA